MKYCSKCGKELFDEAVVCPNCGCAVSNVDVTDMPSLGIAVISFFIPLVGLILYLLFRDRFPMKARSAGKGALIGVGVSIALSILSSVLLGSLFGSMLGSMMY